MKKHIENALVETSATDKPEVAVAVDVDDILDAVATRTGQRHTAIRYGGAGHVDHIKQAIALAKTAPSALQIAQLREAKKINTTMQRTIEIVAKCPSGNSKGHLAWLLGYDSQKAVAESKAEFTRRFRESFTAASV